MVKAFASILRGRLFVAVALMLVMMLTMLTPTSTILFIIAIWLIGDWEIITMFRGQKQVHRGWSLPIVFVFSVAMLSVAQVRMGNNGLALFFQLVWAIWFFDSFALFAGKAVHGLHGTYQLAGRSITLPDTHKIWPEASPNKSWEGFCGGIIFGMISVALTGLALKAFDVQPALTLSHDWLMVLSLLTLGHAGDFCESLLKRKLGVKDSGRLLQDHGGILDRFDAFTFVFAATSILLPLTSAVRSFTSSGIIIGLLLCLTFVRNKKGTVTAS